MGWRWGGDNKIKCYSVLLRGRLSHRPSLPVYWPVSLKRLKLLKGKLKNVVSSVSKWKSNGFGEYYLPNLWHKDLVPPWVPSLTRRLYSLHSLRELNQSSIQSPPPAQGPGPLGDHIHIFPSGLEVTSHDPGSMIQKYKLSVSSHSTL